MQAKILTLLLTARAAAFPAISGTPSTPKNLSLIQYSQSTAELFWDRSIDPDGIRGYELITSDGSQWLGNVTSHLDTNLPTQGDRLYQIISVDSFGNRSDPSIPVTIEMPVSGTSNESSESCTSISNGGTASCSTSSSSQSGNVPSSTDDPINSPQTAPANTSETGTQINGLRAEVYSETALELFWNRVNGTDNAVEYQISREGQLLDIANGTSYFDSGLQGGTLYQYQIVPLINGSSSSPQTIEVRTRGTAQSSSSSSSQSDGRHTSNVYGETYSRSTVEIFWDTTANINQFDIYRNGEYLGNFSTNSLFDDNLTADTNYRYEVYASGAENFLLGDVQLRTSN